MTKCLTGRRYRLEPEQRQARELSRAAGAARFVWNWALAYRNDAWLAAKSAGATGIKANLGYVHLCSLLPDLKRQNPWLTVVSREVLRSALRNLDRAFAAFFGGTGAYPRFKRRGDAQAISCGDPALFCVDGDWVKLPRLGWVRFRLHRPLDGIPRTAAVIRDGGQWHVSFAVKGEFTLPNAGAETVGLDLGVTQSVTLSTGEAVAFPVATAKEERRLKFFQRQAARRQKGSARRQRSLSRVARLRRHIVDRRRDAAHKLSHRLATTHRLIAIEDLKLRNMTRSARGSIVRPGKNVAAKAGLNRVLLAQGHSDFRRMLAYKCERSGAALVVVNPAFTSQACSRCGHIAPENRENQADFRCVACGHQQNADHNAAINILRAASPPAGGWPVAARGGSDISPADEPRTRLKAGRSRARRARKDMACVTP